LQVEDIDCGSSASRPAFVRYTARMKINKDSRSVAPGSKQRTNRSVTAIVFAMIPVLLISMLNGCSGDDEDLIERIKRLNQQGQYEESRAILVDAIEGGRNDPETLLAYGLTLSQMMRRSRAYWPLSAAMEDPELLETAAMQLASNALAIENWEIARRTMDRLLEVEPDFVPALVLRGRASLSTRRNYEEALEDFDRVLELEPDHMVALRSRANALLGLNRPEEALVAIEEASSLSEERASDLAGGSSEDGFWCIVAASFALDSGEREEAKALYEGCLERFPSERRVLTAAVEFFRATGEAARVEEILRAAVEASPDGRECRIALVLNLESSGEGEEALQLLRDATASEQAELAAVAWLDLAGFTKKRGDSEGALAAYQKAKDGFDEPPPELFLAMAETLIQMLRYDEALDLIDESPVAVHRLMVAGRVSLERGDDEQALESFTRVVTIWPDNAPARYYAGLSAERLGDFDRATEEYRHTIRADAEMTEGRQRLARLYMSEGDDDLALNILRQGSATGEEALDANLRLLELELLGRLGRRVADINALPFDPNEPVEDVEARSVAAIASGMRVGRGPERAIQYLLPLIGESPGPAYGVPFRILVEELLRAERVDDALRLAKSAVAAHSEIAEFHVSLALVEIAQAIGNEPGRDALTRALELDPACVPALNEIARLDHSLGRFETARGYFQRALEEMPDDGSAALGLVESLIALGRQEQAEKQLEELLRLHRPFDGELALRLAELREARGASEVARTRALAQRAQRFGAKERAAELMARLSG